MARERPTVKSLGIGLNAGRTVNSAVRQRKAQSMGTWFTKHYALGLLVGVGIGLFVAGMLIPADDRDSLWLLLPVGLLAAVVGGGLYALDRRKP
jgi:membrane protein DedA with SNARE-associated domain